MRKVKAKHLIFVGVLAALATTCMISITPNLRRHSEYNKIVKALQSLSLDRVEAAIQAFVHERSVSGKPLPDAVPLRELASGGRLQTEDIRGLDALDALVSLIADETTPNAILIRVRASDGVEIVLKADGSISKLPR